MSGFKNKNTRDCLQSIFSKDGKIRAQAALKHWLSMSENGCMQTTIDRYLKIEFRKQNIM